MSLVELTEYLVKNLVKDPTTVTVEKNKEDEQMIDVFVSEEDIAAVIGYKGKIANSIRTIVQAAAYVNNQGKVRININPNTK